HPGLWGQRALDDVEVGGVYGAELEAEPLQDLVEEAEGAAVEVLHVDHVVARVEQEHERRLGPEAGCEGEAVPGAFERGQALLERVARGVARARVLEAPVFPHALLGERGGHVDGLDDGAGLRVRTLADMKGTSGKPPAVR